MKLEVGKYYRTRDGRKAGPLEYWDGHTYPFYVRSARRGDGLIVGVGVEYDESGRAGFRHRDRRDLDLVAEWTDEETVTPAAFAEQVVAAFNDLVKAGRIEFSTHLRGASETHPMYGWEDASTSEYRLKPTTRRTTLPDSGYEVVVEGAEVRIGCSELLYINTLTTALKNLLRGDNGEHRVVPLTLRPNRKGIWTERGSITWNDTDHLLAFLEENSK